jgi:CheY-like chemotaxis protein
MAIKTVLIVEDEYLVARNIAEYLIDCGYRVPDVLCKGEQVLSNLENSQKPDIILMDIGLAGSLNGIETARQIRQQFSVPIIFLTAYSSGQIMKEMSEVSPDGIILKPFEYADILTTIQEVIGPSTN